ncbi:MAG TPA: glycosyltransferase family 4 protein [Bryobacteraceae bacterium]|nr:glycosyltransferase family 4 protein [Bryobacteraceae bacterium]
MLSPEAPYPLHGGGAFRTASLLHYFARFSEVDLILLSESGLPALLPPGLVRSQTVIPLPRNKKDILRRYLRNARRAAAGVPPLIDRLSGFGPAIGRAIGGRRYDLGLIEHFWCAPYLNVLGSFCDSVWLDLHNIESTLHEKCAAVSHGFVAAGHRRFAASSQKREGDLLPRYSAVLAASPDDARRAKDIAPTANVRVYPNSIPRIEIPHVSAQPVIAFSGNFEYHPNVDAVRFLANEIWPLIRREFPQFRLRLIGRGDSFIGKLISGKGIETTGPIENALMEIAAADIIVAPLRVGSGTRIKILEAWAAGRPVIATRLAAEGLSTQDGENILFAETPVEFLQAISRVARDRKENQRIGTSGRLTFLANYTWEAAWEALDLTLPFTRHASMDRYTG